MKVRGIALVGLLVLARGLTASDAVPTKLEQPQQMVLAFCNGTLLRQVSLAGTLEMETPYGRLNIPVAEIQRIDFGFRVPADSVDRLAKAAQDLNSPNFAQREAANLELIALGRLAYPTLLRLSQAKGQDLETVRRLDKLLEEIRRKVPHDLLRDNEEDCVHTAKARVCGKLQTQTLKVRAEHFGTVDFPIAHLREAWASNGPAMFTLEPKETYLDTGIDVPAGARISIRALGTLKYNLGDRTIATGPNGHRELQQLIDARVPHNVNYWPGVVMGRVGDEGEELTVGSRFDGAPTTTGRLFLRVATGGATDVPISGAYRIEIEIGPR